MKVSIQEIPENEEEEIVIKCHEINEETTALLHRLKTSREKLTGTLGSEIHKIPLQDIYYFETVDQKSFFYCRKQVYETKLKLYEFEGPYRVAGFSGNLKTARQMNERLKRMKEVLDPSFHAGR